MSNFEKILKSFSVKDTLNPKVWENPKNPSKATMLPKVRKALLRISEEFIDYLGDEVFVDDIVLTGSLANFNWSEFSDFDLHIIVDFQQYEEDAELFKELYNLKKQIFNDKHDIKIFGFNVEVYAQDIEESHYASGVYSILNDEWTSVPKEPMDDVDRELLKTKIKSWTDKIDKVLEDNNKEKLEKIKEKIKEYRKSGLEKDGELSYENLVFKYLRRSGHIEKLFDTVNQLTDKELSIEGQIQEQSTNTVDFDLESIFKNIFPSNENVPEYLKNLSSVSQKNSTSFESSDGLSYLNLNNNEGYQAYKEICQEFINKRNPSSNVTGDMMAKSALKFLNQGYVPPELAVSQLALEGGLLQKKSARPIKTKNPFNVGNVDSGSNQYMSSFQNGVDKYYDLITRKYLSGNKNPADLLNNFVNSSGQRYATDPQYETKLKNIVRSASSISQPIIAKYSSNKSDTEYT